MAASSTARAIPRRPRPPTPRRSQGPAPVPVGPAAPRSPHPARPADRVRTLLPAVVRLTWFILAVILALIGWDLLLRDWLGLVGWLVLGVGVGIAVAVVGSLLHDALAGPHTRL